MKLRLTVLCIVVIVVFGSFALYNLKNIKKKEVLYKSDIIEIESSNAPKKYIKASGERIVSVSFLNGTEDKVTDKRLKELADQHKDAKNINILDVGYLETDNFDVDAENPIIEGNFFKRSIVQGIGITSLPTFTSGVYKTVLYREVLADDKFIDSFPKGLEGKIKNDITVKLSATADGNAFARAGIKLNKELVCKIAKGTTLKGPSEDSMCNSSEIRCAFYQNEGIWERWGVFNGIPYYFWGNFTEPTKYELYAIDRIVRP